MRNIVDQLPVEPQSVIGNDKNKKRFSQPLIYFLIASLFVILGASGCYIYQHQFSKETYILDKSTTNIDNTKVSDLLTSNNPTPTSHPKINSEIVDIGDDTKKYINYEYGFSITFPSYNKSATTCREKQLQQVGRMPLKVFESASANTLFISNKNVLMIRNKQIPGGGYQYDFSTCKSVKNNLDLIENGYDNGIPDKNNLGINITKPEVLKVNYKRITNDHDLETLAQIFYKGCYIGEKNQLANKKDVYRLSLVDQYGQHGPKSGCFTNFEYIFLYSPNNKVAVLTSGFQDAPFNGTNGQSRPEIEFFHLSNN